MFDVRARATQLQLAAIGLLAIGVLAVWGVNQQRRAEHAERLRLEAVVGAVPIFADAPRVTLLPREGDGVPLERYRGRMVFVNFWATWCGPCKAEEPSLLALHASLDPADIAFVSIAEDDSWPPLDRYLKAKPLPFDVYRDQPPRIENLFQTTSYPTSFIIDRDGRVLYRFNGARNWDDDNLRALLALDGVGPR